MSQLVRLEGKHTTQNAHCALHVHLKLHKQQKQMTLLYLNIFGQIPKMNSRKT